MRDKGVCALCGLDTEPLYKQAARLCNPGRWGYVAPNRSRAVCLNLLHPHASL